VDIERLAMEGPVEIVLTFGGVYSGHEPIKAKTLGLYLAYFLTAYNAAERELEGVSLSEFFANREELVENVRLAARHGGIEYALKYGYRHELEIETMAHGSPLSMAIKGILVAMAAAVIISGGTVEMGPQGIRFEVPPIGEGIYALEEALH
jgi:hypothetical protein